MTPVREIEHTADRAFRVEGRNLRELFANAAEAIFGTQRVPRRGPVRISRDVRVEGLDPETLLVNFLNELLYREELHGEIYDRCEVLGITQSELTARAHGTAGLGRIPIKAVTFHNLKIAQVKNGWRAVLVVDV